MAATWTAIVIDAAPELAESIGSFLLDQGAPGLATEEDGASARVIAHFSGTPPLAAVERFCDRLPEFFPGSARPEVHVEQVTDSGWAESWKAHFPPLEVGSRLFVHPPWVRERPAGRQHIVIDPGMAFGTGNHASTRGCLVLLERAGTPRPAARVLDLGTGSGILAIAAAKLGAHEVWAVDIDPDACAAARANAAANDVAARVRVSDSAAELAGRFDIVLANLFGRQLIELAAPLSERLSPGGVLIGAGLLAAEEAAVARAWQAAGLTARDRYEEESWVAIAYARA